MSGIPFIGQTAAAERQFARQVFLQCYLSLLPVAAGPILSEAVNYPDRATMNEEIVSEAFDLAVLAVGRIGISVPRNEGHGSPVGENGHDA